MKKEQWDTTAKANVVLEEDEQVNQASALWARPKSAITEEQYHEFYKHVAHDFEPPLAYSHAKVEGRQEYTQLLFIPRRAPYDLWDREHRHGIKLYVRRVFIMDDAEQLMPAYLRFVRGVIDSNDLPLNVSREILQQSKDVETIRAASVKRVLGAAGRSGRAPRREVRDVLEGIRPRVQGRGGARMPRTRSGSPGSCASRPPSGDTDEQTVSLSAYAGRMKEGQDAIYYITADSWAAARNSPHLEVFRKLGVEVLLMYDRIDEWVVSVLTDFDGKPLRSVARGDLDLSKLAPQVETPEPEKEQAALPGRARSHEGSALADRAGDVRITHRLTDSPACLVSDEHGMSMNLERLLKASGQQVRQHQAHPRDQSRASDHRQAPQTSRTATGSRAGVTSCSTRRRWPRAARSTTRRRSSNVSTSCC